MSKDICSLLFNQIDKPKNFEMCKAINIYDNKYRINIYTRIHDSIYDIEKKRITQSYFAKLKDNELIIIA